MVVRQVAICSFAFSALLALATFASGADQSAPAVKKSKNGICHDVQSPNYRRTKNFVAFNSMAECLESGGRYPKRTSTAKAHSSDSDTGLSSLVRSGTNRLRRAVFWVEEHPAIATAIALFGVFLYGELRHYIRRRRVRKRDRSTAERERAQWSAHRRESSLSESADALFKHRRHRQDPWLKLVGYFRRQKRRG
jgi:hypothetical protein